MMSLIDLDDDQGWVPTHVNVTVLRARGLRTKGKHGSRYLYSIIQVAKEKYTTGLVEKAEVPEWNEECCFELLPGILEEGGRSAYPPGSGDLVLTVMHRVLIGLDVFLGQAVIPLDQIFQQGTCPRDEWFKLNSKAGRKEKERGELQVTVKFTRNNMTASMFDLTIKDKPRSAFGKLKDRVTGRKRGDVESSSAIVPGRYAALSGSLGQPFGGEGAGVAESRDVEAADDKRSKVKDFFKGRLRKSSDTRSCTSLASESSMSSMASDNPAPPPALDLLSDPPSSPIYSSKVRTDPHYGESDLAKKAVLTSQRTTNVLTHKRAFSDEASKVTTAFPRPNPAVESLRSQTMTQSKSSLCINGSHVYDSEPSTPKGSAALPSKLVLLEKCSPLSRSLQNLTKRSEGPFAEDPCWSADRMEEEAQARSPPGQKAQAGDRPVQAAMPIVSSAASSPEKGRKLRKTLFSGGRSDSLPAKADASQAASTAEGRLRGWFGSGDSQNKPRLEVSPKVESSPDVPPPLPPRSPVRPQCCSASPSGQALPDEHIQPFTPSSSPSSPPISPSNPFLPGMQHNPFFEELLAEGSQRSPPLAPGSSPFHYTTVTPQPCTPGPNAANITSIKRERPRPVARQVSLPAFEAATQNAPDLSAPRSLSESAGEWEESFDAFASSRLNSPKGGLPHHQLRTSPPPSHRRSHTPVNSSDHTQELRALDEEPPPLPPRRPLRAPVGELYSDGWLHRGQELAVHKEAYLLSQTGVASLQRGREEESRRSRASPDPQASGEASDARGARSQPHANATPPGFTGEEKLRKFRYEPLQDDSDCWGGLLFEQDLYGRTCRGNYGKVTNPHLSLCTEETGSSGHKTLLSSEISLTGLLNMSSASSPNPDAKVPEITTTPAEETVEFNPETNNNVSFSPTLGDMNMNVNNSDFSFIDSDGSSQSDAAEKGSNCFVGTFQPPPLVVYRAETAPEELFTLKDTYIPETNSSFEIPPSSNKLCKVSPVCQDCRCGLTHAAPHGACRVNGGDATALPPPAQQSSRDGKTGSEGAFKQTRVDVDDNGNVDVESGPLSQAGSVPGVVSARFRPRGVTQQSSRGSANKRSDVSGDAEFEQLLSLVQNISRAREGPWSHQSVSSAVSSLGALDEQTDLALQCNTDSRISSKDERAEISFKDLHAKVAPNPRSPPGSLRPESSPSTPAAQADLHPTPLCCTSSHPSRSGPSAGASTTLAVAPYTSSYSTTSTSDQPQVAAPPSLLPEETQPASSLPRQESRSHPVKPLTSSQSEKKESRSVLEKLKSTIHPGRSAQQVAAEPERTVEVAANSSAQYQHLTNMELISLLLQQEMDMQKQQAASEQQGAQLEKCEAELRKVKAQVRDLEDYIDNLLLRIMEQTPTLLQVRTRHK